MNTLFQRARHHHIVMELPPHRLCAHVGTSLTSVQPAVTVCQPGTQSLAAHRSGKIHGFHRQNLLHNSHFPENRRFCRRRLTPHRNIWSLLVFAAGRPFGCSTEQINRWAAVAILCCSSSALLRGCLVAHLAATSLSFGVAEFGRQTFAVATSAVPSSGHIPSVSCGSPIVLCASGGTWNRKPFRLLAAPARRDLRRTAYTHD